MADEGATQQTAIEPKKFGHSKLQPGAYYLDLEETRAIPVSINGQPSTFYDAYCKCAWAKVVKIPDKQGEAYVVERIPEDELRALWDMDHDAYEARATPAGTLEIRCHDRRSWDTLRTLVKLKSDGIDHHELTWFYYGQDHVTDDYQTAHHFFVAHKDTVLIEDQAFSHDYPMILKKPDSTYPPTWSSEPHFDVARERYWYGRFYKESRMGQLMVLRPDRPILFHYERPEGRDAFQKFRTVLVLQLISVNLPLLAAIVFPEYKAPLGIIALALLVLFFWCCWDTRKFWT